MLHVATRTILGGRDPAKMKKRESSYFIFVFALMTNFKFSLANLGCITRSATL